MVLADGPRAYWTLGATGGLIDKTGRGHAAASPTGTGFSTLPNGDSIGVFNGTTQYVETPDADDLSVTATGILTIEAWMRPDVLEFPSQESTGYVHWMGKGDPNQQEYVARMYSLTNSESRPNRISGYAFNLAGGGGAGSYFQDSVSTGEWIHYVLVINTLATSTTYPTGYTKIYKNGVQRDQDSLSGYSIVPGNGTSPLRIGTRDFASYFKGAIGKVVIYDYELPAARALAHYQAGSTPATSNQTIINVSTAAQLTTALANAAPGQTIQLADGTYSGRFSMVNKTATASQPIIVQGSNNAIINGGATSGGYAFYLDTCRYVTLKGFQVTGAQKSVVMDSSNFCMLDGLQTHDCGAESILVRNLSCDNTIKNCEVYNTGLVSPGYGEGIYIGVWYGGWSGGSSRTGGAPDACDRNQILNNNIHDTAAECIDIKEGTSGGLIQGNTLEGANMSGVNYADSWIDIAGNGYVVEYNTGTNAKLDGIQTHTQPQPAVTASNNIFRHNTLAVNAGGYGVYIDTAGSGNIVYTNNTATGATKGLTNITATP